MQILVNVDVPDLDRAIDFYCRALGLRLARRLFDGTVAELAGGSMSLLLTLKEAGSSPGGGMSAASFVTKPMALIVMCVSPLGPG